MPEDSDANRVRAYVLIETQPEMTWNVVRNLRRKRNIRSVDAINGPFGVIAVVEGDSPSSVATGILVGIKKARGVKDIVVYLVETKEEGYPPQKYLSGPPGGDERNYHRRVKQ